MTTTMNRLPVSTWNPLGVNYAPASAALPAVPAAGWAKAEALSPALPASFLFPGLHFPEQFLCQPAFIQHPSIHLIGIQVCACLLIKGFHLGIHRVPVPFCSNPGRLFFQGCPYGCIIRFLVPSGRDFHGFRIIYIHHPDTPFLR